VNGSCIEKIYIGETKEQITSDGGETATISADNTNFHVVTVMGRAIKIQRFKSTGGGLDGIHTPGNPPPGGGAKIYIDNNTIENNSRKEMNKMKIKLATTLAVPLCFALLGIFGFTAVAQEAPRITKEEVLGMLGNPDVIIIDVRSGGDRNGSELKIKGAVREDPRNVSLWIDKYPKDKTLIFY
jgi:hypothetical protein